MPKQARKLLKFLEKDLSFGVFVNHSPSGLNDYHSFVSYGSYYKAGQDLRAACDLRVMSGSR